MYGNLMMYFRPDEKLAFEKLEHCPICKADLTHADRIDTETIYLHDLAPGSEIVRCVSCGVVLQKRRLAECEWERFNESFPSDGSARWDKNPFRFDPELRSVASHCPRGAAVLDIGCGFGELVQLLQEQGYASEGVDIRASALEYGKRKLGLRLHGGFYNEEIAVELGQRFDAVISVHAFEHFHDPLGTLRAMNHNLREKGVVFLTVPDAEPLDPDTGIMPFDFYTSAHPFYYDSGVMGNILKAADFEVVSIEKGFDAVSERPVLRAIGRKNGRAATCLAFGANGPSAGEMAFFQGAFILRREKEILKNLALPKPMKIAVYGAWLYGLLTVKALEHAGHHVQGIVDSDTGKRHHLLAGYPIQDPEFLRDCPSIEAVIVTSLGGFEPIEKRIRSDLGLSDIPVLPIAGGLIRKVV